MNKHFRFTAWFVTVLFLFATPASAGKLSFFSRLFGRHADDAVKVVIHNADDAVKLGVHNADDAAKLAVHNGDDAAKTFIGTSDDAAKSVAGSSDDLAKGVARSADDAGRSVANAGSDALKSGNEFVPIEISKPVPKAAAPKTPKAPQKPVSPGQIVAVGGAVAMVETGAGLGTGIYAVGAGAGSGAQAVGTGAGDALRTAADNAPEATAQALVQPANTFAGWLGFAVAVVIILPVSIFSWRFLRRSRKTATTLTNKSPVKSETTDEKAGASSGKEEEVQPNDKNDTNERR